MNVFQKTWIKTDDKEEYILRLYVNNLLHIMTIFKHTNDIWYGVVDNSNKVFEISFSEENTIYDILAEIYSRLTGELSEAWINKYFQLGNNESVEETE